MLQKYATDVQAKYCTCNWRSVSVKWIIWWSQSRLKFENVFVNPKHIVLHYKKFDYRASLDLQVIRHLYGILGPTSYVWGNVTFAKLEQQLQLLNICAPTCGRYFRVQVEITPLAWKWRHLFSWQRQFCLPSTSQPATDTVLLNGFWQCWYQ